MAFLKYHTIFIRHLNFYFPMSVQIKLFSDRCTFIFLAFLLIFAIFIQIHVKYYNGHMGKSVIGVIHSSNLQLTEMPQVGRCRLTYFSPAQLNCSRENIYLFHKLSNLRNVLGKIVVFHSMRMRMSISSIRGQCTCASHNTACSVHVQCVKVLDQTIKALG